MGGFLLLHNRNEMSKHQVQNALEVFSNKEMALYKHIKEKLFDLYVFHKIRKKNENTLILNNGDFIVATGTFIFQNLIGIPALEKAYHTFSISKEFFNNLSGCYGLLVYKDKRLYILNDELGLYHIYSTKQMTMISTSFISIVRSISHVSLDEQVFYEYLFHESTLDEQSLITGIQLIHNRKIIEFADNIVVIQRPLHSADNHKWQSYNYNLKATAQILIKYFQNLKDSFGNNICSALSGGFDSRLLLAVMRKVGIEPYLYVYGPDRSLNVKVSLNIGRGEGLEIDHINREKIAFVKPVDYPDLIKKQFYLYDGQGIHGIFNNGMDLITREQRVKQNRLQLNGAGGEVLRNFYGIPDCKMPIRSFARIGLRIPKYLQFLKKFNRQKYYSIVETKIRNIYNRPFDKLTFTELESLFPFFRLKTRIGVENTISNQFGYTVTPFIEPPYAYNSFIIPHRYKNLGKFEGALIKYLDKNLSKYTSTHGFDFYHGPGFFTEVRYLAGINAPVFMRYLMKDLRELKNKKKINDNYKGDFPYYLTEEYLQTIFNVNKLKISEYVDIEKVYNPQMLARMLSVELLISDIF